MSPDLRQAGERAFAVPARRRRKVCAQVAPQSRPPALMIALHIWALSHGIASLFGARRFGPPHPADVAEELLEAGVLVYLRGLELPHPGAAA